MPREAPSRGGLGGRGQQRGASQGGLASAPRISCEYCRKPNHTKKNCWRKERKCLYCGSADHQIANCPVPSREECGTQQSTKTNPGQSKVEGNRPKVLARVYALEQHQVPDSSEVVEDTIPIFHRLAKILIDFGATHSFVNPNFICGIDVKPARLPYDLEVSTPTGDQRLITSMVYKNCEIWVVERKLLRDLISLAIKGYDVILGMDWLVRYDVQLDYKRKVVEFCIPGEATLRLDVRGRLVSTTLISEIRVRKLLSKGAQDFLAFVINTPTDKLEVENAPVVKEYPDMFPDELVTLPPKKEIEIKFDLLPRTSAISKTPYWMAPTELKELKLQLQDLL
ncbi:uncharacterized protein LOC113780316 [Coffea eugenioides]|uniref:uncharacterized protein LOC113780316 n=1 Tax=Coffea eugenioides TaxID=49369 RepID=UPI000F611AFD|nr:uncharacterized protein LOC113780316 [Coffea eugenioides]